MDETPLLGGKKQHDKSCLIPSFLAGVLGVLLVGCVIGLIVVASSRCDCGPASLSYSSSTPAPAASSSHPVPPAPASSSAPAPASSSAPAPASSSAPAPASSSAPAPASSSAYASASSSAFASDSSAFASASSSILDSSSTFTSESSTAASSSAFGPITFTEFSAEIYSRSCDSYDMHCTMSNQEMMYVYGPGKYSMEEFGDDGTIVTRQWSTESDKSCYVCQDVGNHGNCFRRTMSSDDVYFSTEGLALLAQGVDCYQIYPALQTLIPNRTLDKCDYYSGVTYLLPSQENDMIIQTIVESETGYPVIAIYKDYQTASSTATIFATFVAEKPEEGGHLQPFPGVTVYDLRDGEVNEAEQATFSVKRDAKENDIIRLMRRRDAIRQRLHLPLVQSVSGSFAHGRNTVARDDIPAEFDARQNWADCADTIGAITNQDVCGSCWAMSSAAVLADRFCIAQKPKGLLSPQFMVYCGEHTSGCQGSSSAVGTWEQLINQGTVSDNCIPFTARNGACPRRCQNGTLISDDMIYHADGVAIPWDNSTDARVQAIQTEIMTNGPVQAIFQVFYDLMKYSGGIYQRTKDAFIVGGHAVRIVGWGTENGVDYWLVANSWGTDWGEGGFFRIRRGVNECNIEEVVLAGIVGSN